MAVTSRAVTVGTTATRLDLGDDSGDAIVGESLTIYNLSASVVYVGGPGVTVANGVPVAASAWGPSMDLAGGDALYGIVAAATAEVRVLEAGV